MSATFLVRDSFTSPDHSPLVDLSRDEHTVAFVSPSSNQNVSAATVLLCHKIQTQGRHLNAEERTIFVDVIDLIMAQRGCSIAEATRVCGSYGHAYTSRRHDLHQRGVPNLSDLPEGDIRDERISRANQVIRHFTDNSPRLSLFGTSVGDAAAPQPRMLSIDNGFFWKEGAGKRPHLNVQQKTAFVDGICLLVKYGCCRIPGAVEAIGSSVTRYGSRIAFLRDMRVPSLVFVHNPIEYRERLTLGIRVIEHLAERPFAEVVRQLNPELRDEDLVELNVHSEVPAGEEEQTRAVQSEVPAEEIVDSVELGTDTIPVTEAGSNLATTAVASQTEVTSQFSDLPLWNETTRRRLTPRQKIAYVDAVDILAKLAGCTNIAAIHALGSNLKKYTGRREFFREKHIDRYEDAIPSRNKSARLADATKVIEHLSNEPLFVIATRLNPGREIPASPFNGLKSNHIISGSENIAKWSEKTIYLKLDYIQVRAFIDAVYHLADLASCSLSKAVETLGSNDPRYQNRLKAFRASGTPILRDTANGPGRQNRIRDAEAVIVHLTKKSLGSLVAELENSALGRTRGNRWQSAGTSNGVSTVKRTSALGTGDDEPTPFKPTPNPTGNSYGGRRGRSIIEAIKLGDFEFEPAHVDKERFPSTRAVPGTEEKIEVLAARIRAGLPLWHHDDRKDYGDDNDND